MAPWSKSDRLIDNDPVTGHVTKDGFGRETDHIEALINFVEKVGVKNSWDLPYFMAVFYDSVYKVSERCYTEDFELKRFEEATNPLRMVSMNTKEGLMESNRYRKRFYEYTTYEVCKYTGLSFDKWLALPTFLLEQLLDDLRTTYMIREQHRDKIARELDSVPKDRHESSIDALTRGSKYRPPI